VWRRPAFHDPEQSKPPPSGAPNRTIKSVPGIGDVGARTLIAEISVSQIVMGTDYPFPWTKTAVGHILATPGLSDSEPIAMLGDRSHGLDSVEATVAGHDL
jgi:hypothetical protein